MKPYTYLIGWSNHKLYYYGVRYAKTCDPLELWVTYFTSSKYVKEFVKNNGDPDIISIRKTFNDANSARAWESKVLKRLCVKDRNDFLNMTDNKSISLDACKKGQEKIDYIKVGQSLKKFYENADKEYIEEIKSKRRKGLLNKSEYAAKKQSEGIREYQKKSWSDPIRKEERSKLMRKPKSKSQCPHCNKIGGSGIMKRWHFDNCKAIGG
jgi:hypothetical protein